MQGRIPGRGIVCLNPAPLQKKCHACKNITKVRINKFVMFIRFCFVNQPNISNNISEKLVGGGVFEDSMTNPFSKQWANCIYYFCPGTVDVLRYWWNGY